jgi:hypothetical protein
MNCAFSIQRPGLSVGGKQEEKTGEACGRTCRLTLSFAPESIRSPSASSSKNINKPLWYTIHAEIATYLV